MAQSSRLPECTLAYWRVAAGQRIRRDEEPMNEGCIFCKIVRGDFKTEFVAESERAVAFNDISPAAPVHVLVAPKQHIAALRDLDDLSLGGELLGLVQQVATASGLHES